MRRRALLSAGGATVLAMAAGLGAGVDDESDDGPTAAVETYYRRANAAADADAFAADVEELAYDASPLVDIAEDTPLVFDDPLDQTVRSTEVVAEDVGRERIRGISDFLAASLDDDELAAVAEENALVATTLDDPSAGEVTIEWLVATRDGEWRVVWPGGGPGPETAVLEYYRRGDAAADAADFAAEVEEIAHSDSPLVDLAEDTPSVFDDPVRQTLRETEVIGRNVDETAIRNVSDFLAASLGEEGLAAVAEENAVVATTVADPSLAGGEVAFEWLVAIEDDEWRVVWPDERDGPEAVVREYYRTADAAEEATAFGEELARLAHDRSPLVDVDPARLYGAADSRELVAASIVEEDLDAAGVLRSSGFLADWLTEDDLAALSGENALVEARVTDERIDGEEYTQEWLVATDGGVWRLVWF